jgi:hypothetical protein
LSRRPAAVLALALVALGLAGCGAKPAPIPESDGELGTRPGLISGPSGEFVLYQK